MAVVLGGIGGIQPVAAQVGPLQHQAHGGGRPPGQAQVEDVAGGAFHLVAAVIGGARNDPVLVGVLGVGGGQVQAQGGAQLGPQAQFHAPVAGLAGVHHLGDVGEGVPVTEDVVLLAQVIEGQAVVQATARALEAHLELVRLHRLQVQGGQGVGGRHQGGAGGRRPEQLAFRGGPEGAVEGREYMQVLGQGVAGAQLGAQVLEAHRGVRHLAIKAGDRRAAVLAGAGRHRCGADVVVEAVAQVVVAQPGLQPPALAGRELAMHIRRGAHEGHVVVVDPGAHRIGGVDLGGAGAAGGQGRQPVLLPAAGAQIQIQAGDEAGAHFGKVPPPFGQHPEGGVLGGVDGGVVAQGPVGQQRHAVVPQEGREGHQGVAALPLPGRGQAQGVHLAIGDGGVVAGGVVPVIGIHQGGTAGGLLVDAGEGQHGLQHRVLGQGPVPAQGAALPVIAGGVPPAVGMGKVQVGAQAVVAPGVAAAQQSPAPAVAAGFAAGGKLGLGGGRAGQDVDHAADGVGTIQRRARALADLDAAGGRQVDLVKGVVVEEAGGAGGDAVLQVEVDRRGGQRLADGGHVAFAAGHVDPDAGHLAHDLGGVGRLVLAQGFRLDETDAGGGLRQGLGLPGAGDGDVPQDGGFGMEGGGAGP